MYGIQYFFMAELAPHLDNFTGFQHIYGSVE